MFASLRRVRFRRGRRIAAVAAVLLLVQLWGTAALPLAHAAEVARAALAGSDEGPAAPAHDELTCTICHAATLHALHASGVVSRVAEPTPRHAAPHSVAPAFAPAAPRSALGSRAPPSA